METLGLSYDVGNKFIIIIRKKFVLKILMV